MSKKDTKTVVYIKLTKTLVYILSTLAATSMVWLSNYYLVSSGFWTLQPTYWQILAIVFAVRIIVKYTKFEPSEIAEKIDNRIKEDKE